MAVQETWVHARVKKTSAALDHAFAEKLTGHTFIGRDGKQVTLSDGIKCIEFISCSYLGLELHEAFTKAIVEAATSMGGHFSSSRNRMRPFYLPELEGYLEKIYPRSVPIVFTSVSSCHLGVLPLLAAGSLPSYPVADEGVCFLIEKTAHASMQVLWGVFQQLGKVQRFNGQDLADLRDKLQVVSAEKLTPIVLTDGVGSMGGLFPLPGMLELVTRYRGYLYIDDAHGISISGPSGCGYAHQILGCTVPQNVILAGSLSKAFGGSGGFLLVSHEEDSKQIQKAANPLVFGHSIMLPMLAGNMALAKLHVNGNVELLQKKLWDNVKSFDDLTSGCLINAGLDSPVRGAVFPQEELALQASRALKKAGVLILPAFYPSVAKGCGLVRFAISSLHTADHIKLAAAEIMKHKHLMSTYRIN